MYFLDVIIENNDLLDKLEICAFSSICLLFYHYLHPFIYHILHLRSIQSIYSFIYLSYTPSILHLRSIQSLLFIHLFILYSIHTPFTFHPIHLFIHLFILYSIHTPFTVHLVHLFILYSIHTPFTFHSIHFILTSSYLSSCEIVLKLFM